MKTLLIYIGVINATFFSASFIFYDKLPSVEKYVASDRMTNKEKLGKHIFFDTNLSIPKGQACASCHSPIAGFADPTHSVVHEGATKGLFGNRNTPTIAYSSFSPDFHYDKFDSVYVGGAFLDGRQRNIKSQAADPMFNPLEMNSNRQHIINSVKNSSYATDLKGIYGSNVFDDGDESFDCIIDALVAYESCSEVNSFSSKYDKYLSGDVRLTEQELRGMRLFKDEDKGNCAACHTMDETSDEHDNLFTDFTFDNLGVMKNDNSPFFEMPWTINPLGDDYLDLGLGAAINDPTLNGAFKVPTLRNIALTAPYMHNGVFSTLEEVLDFYNKRDLKAFEKPEYPITMNREELGDLKLTDQEEKDIIAFLKTLTDGYGTVSITE